MDITGKVNNLILNKIYVNNLNKYQDIWDESAYISEFTGVNDLSNSFEENYKNPNLPPEGNINNLYRYEINDVNNLAIGYLEYYVGYINSDDIYIGFLYVSKKHQGKKYGSEIINYLILNSKKLKINRILAHVAMKNFAAIWFWHKLGFNKILELDGDKYFGNDKYMNMVMEYSIK